MANRLSKDKARAIAVEYCSNGRKRRDALKAVGYAKSYAESGLGMKLYDNILVKAEITAIDVAKEAKDAVSVNYVVTKLQEVAERCMQEMPILDEDGEETGEWQFKDAGANRALELLGKHVGAFEKDNSQGRTQLQLNIANQQAFIKEAIALGKALDDAPDAMAK